MKKILIFMSVVTFTAVLFFSSKSHFPLSGLPSESKETFAIQKHLQTFHPIQEDKHFIVFVLVENASETCERQLRSVFDQTYENYEVVYLDNGSVDQSLEKAKAFCEKEQWQDKITFTRHAQKKAAMEVIYDTIHQFNSKDIVVFLEGQDWLSHENVLEHLNCAYAHPDVWLTYGRVIRHPDYQQVEGKAFSDQFLQKKKLRAQIEPSFPMLATFSAAYFKEVRLEDLLFGGKFIDEKAKCAFLFPLFEMGSEHVLFMDEVMLVKNDMAEKVDHKEHLHHVMATESYLRSLGTYSNLNALRLNFPTSNFYRNKGDVLIFSEDSPLHLYACLESLHLNARDINEVYVIYQSHDHEFGRSYLNLKNEFPSVQFLDVCDYPGNDFTTLLSKAVENRRYGAPYLLITDDHYVFEQKLRLHECINALEKVHADHFFLTLDETEIKGPLPEAISVGDGIYAWQMGEEGQKQSPFMCVCRKSLLEKGVSREEVKDLSAFKQVWKKLLPHHAVALFYEEKKSLPLKLQQEATLTQKKEWGNKFIEGYKIDLPSLVCEMDEMQGGNYPLIKREKQRSVLR